jgi:monoamine oxidase
MIRRAFDASPARLQASDARASLRAFAPELPPAVAALRERGDAGKGKIVIVVGAGMAGLCAAYELERLGFEVMVLEADESHIGGRVRTLRMGDLYGEAGAMRVPADHDLTRFYARTAGVELRRFVQANPLGFLHVRGTRVRMEQAAEALPSFCLTEEERALGDVGLWKKAVSALVAGLTEKEVQDLYADRPVTPRVRELERRSLYSQLTQAGLSPDAIQLLASAWNLEPALHVSLIEHLREEHEGTWVEEFDEIVGGMDSMPRGIAGMLRNRVRLGCPVVAVRREGSRVSATFLRDGQVPETVSADWMICTVPLGVLSRIAFTPALPAMKADAARRITYDSATKVLAVARRRFWESDDGIFGGGSISDGILGSTWYPSDNTDGDPRLTGATTLFLASYTWGQMARRMSPAKARDEVVHELGRLHDSLTEEPDLITHQVRWSWDEHPWSGGAYAFYSPGEHGALFEALVEPEGKLLFAGEHASHTHSWIQGAIASGLHAALHIAQRSQGA